MIQLIKIKNSSDLMATIKNDPLKSKLIILKKGRIKTVVNGREICLSGYGIINKSPITNSQFLEAETTDAFVVEYDDKERDILLSQAFILLCPMTGVFRQLLSPKQFDKLNLVLELLQHEKSNSEIALLLVLLIIKYLDSFRNEESVVNIANHPIVSEFVRLTNKDFCISHEVKYYANKMSISDRTLNRVFKEFTGITPKQSLTFRLNVEAKKNLIKQMSVKEISYALGFSTPEYFNSFFNKQNGYSPSAYFKGLSYNHGFLS
jgi:AraC-like DNA-binding protein